MRRSYTMSWKRNGGDTGEGVTLGVVFGFCLQNGQFLYIRISADCLKYLS